MSNNKNVEASVQNGFWYLLSGLFVVGGLTALVPTICEISQEFNLAAFGVGLIMVGCFATIFLGDLFNGRCGPLTSNQDYFWNIMLILLIGAVISFVIGLSLLEIWLGYFGLGIFVGSGLLIAYDIFTR